MPDPQIVAIGGLGDDEAAGTLVEFVLGLTGKARPRVCIVPTASAEDPGLLVAFYEELTKRRTAAAMAVNGRATAAQPRP